MKDSILLRIKKFCNGEINAIYSSELERHYGLSGPALRAIIRELRREGEPIGGCGKGYFYCTNSAELTALIEDLNGRANSLKVTVSALKRNYENPSFMQSRLF